MAKPSEIETAEIATAQTKPIQSEPADMRPDPRADERPQANPKKSPDASGASNQIKDPDDWVTGGEPMTGAQASYLKTLSEQVHKDDAFDPRLDKAEASKRIDDLKHQAGR